MYLSAVHSDAVAVYSDEVFVYSGESVVSEPERKLCSVFAVYPLFLFWVHWLFSSERSFSFKDFTKRKA